MKAQDIYDREYAGCAKSPEWKAGALYGLRLELGGSRGRAPRYEIGTAPYDAWAAGIMEGRAQARWLVERAAKTQTEHTA